MLLFFKVFPWSYVVKKYLQMGYATICIHLLRLKTVACHEILYVWNDCPLFSWNLPNNSRIWVSTMALLYIPSLCKSQKSCTVVRSICCISWIRLGRYGHLQSTSTSTPSRPKINAPNAFIANHCVTFSNTAFFEKWLWASDKNPIIFQARLQRVFQVIRAGESCQQWSKCEKKTRSRAASLALFTKAPRKPSFIFQWIVG